MSARIRIAVVGMGKIAKDQHLPAIAAVPDFDLVATVSRSGESIDGKPHFHDIEALAASGMEIDAVALCTPPQVRRRIAQFAIDQGWHVFLEKPPGATLSEVEALRKAADARGISLFASWHSRFADGVEPARAWLAGRTIRSATITWREDVRVWHPGQDWIWEPGGFGVFDPGINALSIVTEILPGDWVVHRADLHVPDGRMSPLAADIDLTCGDIPVTAAFDFLHEGPQQWDIVVETDGGTLKLSMGGAILDIDGTVTEATDAEYPGLYAKFAALVGSRSSDVDVTPLRLVADAFLVGRRTIVPAFEW